MSNDPIQLLQLSDPHLFETPGKTLLGIDTRASLAATVDHIRANGKKADALLVTGDLAQNCLAGAYEQFLSMVQPLGLPLHALPGNHDHAATLRSALGERAHPVADYGAWRIILLDSSVAGSAAGHLADDQLELLREHARTNDDRHVLVAMHHQPIPMNSRWLDTMQISNSSELFQALEELPQVRALVWGHVHQAYDGWHQWSQQPGRAPLRLLATPSTCFQFLPASEEFALDPTPPGYRWIQLHADGRLNTELIRLPDIPAAAGYPSLDSQGY